MKVSISYYERNEQAAHTGTFVSENEEKIMVYNEPAAETEGALFYEVLDSVGDAAIANGFAVLNNIAVTEEGRPIFEDRFKNRARLIENDPGFQMIRVLRPLSDDTYVIMTVWDEEESFKNWQTSQSYQQAHQKRHTPQGIDQQKSIFPRPSFVSTFQI